MPNIFPMTYNDLVEYVAENMNVSVSQATTALNNAGVYFDTFERQAESGVLRDLGINISYSKAGLPNGAYLTSGATSRGSQIYRELSNVNSNVVTTTRSNFNIPLNTTVEESTGNVIFSKLRGGVASGANFLMGEVAPAVCAASVGISLGKQIDSTLYNLNPEFWDANGMSTLNPDTWSGITNGDDSLGANLFNMIFGIDPNTGNTQAYIDENALAYMALYMKEHGAFDDMPIVSSYTPTSSITTQYYPVPLGYSTASQFNAVFANKDWYFSTSGDSTVYAVWGAKSGASSGDLYFISSQPFKYGYSDREFITPNNDVNRRYSVEGITYYARNIGWTMPYVSGLPLYNINLTTAPSSSSLAYILLSGNHEIQSSVEGINNQEGATVPDLSGISTIPDMLTSLQTQLPNLWGSPVYQDTVQPDGTVLTKTFVPVGFPDISNFLDTQPTTSNQSQSDPQINPNTDTDTLIDTLIQTLTQPDYPYQTPTNPPTTGDGSTPTPTPPVGTASSLWAIYHPTQSQIDSFGAWLWSSDFVDQILKIFNNPMESVIGLHKVYATPIDAGTRTIKVGYLDSGISSNYIEEQYVTVDCGSVHLSEYFGNVFDYDPFTRILLYLPFVGIVQLNTGDVMRSTISITYGVDVLTGACLAMVDVTRDMGGGVLYQYAGNCAVQYPISSGSYVGIISGIASVAGGIAGTIASGGTALPAIAGAASAALNSHTTVQHSGGFSGNAGAMGGKIPYLIVIRPQTKLADNYAYLQGYPTNKTVTLNECSGIVRVKDVHINGINATDYELNEIESMLKSGITI